MDTLGDLLWDLTDRSAERALHHGLGGFLHLDPPAAAGAEARRTFAAAHRRTLMRNLFFLAVTREVLCILQEAGIAVLPLKGVLFAGHCYGDLGARPQSDVDVLVRESDLPAAHARLIGSGWREYLPRAYYRDHYHWTYAREDVLVELHWALKPPGTCSPDLRRVWERASEVREEGLVFPAMSPEDTLAYFAVNKGMQHFPHLIDFVDLAMAMRAASIDWDRFGADAVRDGTAGPIWYGLTFCRERLGVAVPLRVLRTLARHARPAEWLHRLIANFGGPHRLPDAWLDGPIGRVYEAFLEGRLATVLALLRPLLLPSRARVEALAEGSFRRYVLGQTGRLCRSLLGIASGDEE